MPDPLTPDQFRTLATRLQTEREVQSQIVAELRHAGYLVLETSQKPRRCWHCHRYPPGGKAGTGVSRGIPDLLARDKDWPCGLWCGLECKSATGKPTPEQQTLADLHALHVVRSPTEALAVMADLNQRIKET